MREAGGREEAVFSRLLGRLLGAGRYKTGVYLVCERLPRDRHVIYEGGAVNRMWVLRSKLRSNLNRLVRSTKCCTNTLEMLKHLLGIALEGCLNQAIKSISAAV